MENNYQLSRIHNYVNGLLSKEDMYSLEREALDDPFLQDAIDGYKLQQGVDIKQLSLLQQRLSKRVAQQVSTRNKYFYSWQRLAIGAVAAVMFVTVCTLIFYKNIHKSKTADLSEVVFKDAIFEYNVIPQNSENNAIPTNNWNEFYDVLNAKYSNSQNYEGHLDIQFDIDKKGKAYNLHIEGAGFEKDEELEELLRNKIKWKGERAHFILEMDKINFTVTP